MTRERATFVLREWNERKSLCLTGQRLDGNPDGLSLTRFVQGDLEFREKTPYRVDTFHEIGERGVFTMNRTVEFYDDPDKAMDVLSSAGIIEFQKCPEGGSL